METVLGLIIDDGVSSRGHRKNIYSKDFKYVGIYSAVCGDKIATCMDYHSEDLKVIEPSKKPLGPGYHSGKNVPQSQQAEQ